MEKIVLFFLVLTSLMYTSLVKSISVNCENSYSDLSKLCSAGEEEVLNTKTNEEKIVASFAKSECHEELETYQNPAAPDSLKTDIYIVRKEEKKCPVIYVVVTKKAHQTDMVHAFGEMTVGEGCSSKDFFSEIDVKGKSPNNLAETIENNLDVSYAIKRWYFDYISRKE